jgi:ABC-type lipoprotein export system ATPase subunit
VSYSRFFLCDLHVHTPADARQGYGDVGGRAPNDAFARRLIQAHADSGVTVLAVSDHNRVDWYPVLRKAGDDMGVFVFPALEFSVNRCHLLAIWDRTEQGFAMAHQFLTTLWKPGADAFEANGDPRPVGHGQVLEWAQRAAEHRAIVLAPHATAKNIGLLASGVCTNRKEVIQSGLIAGYDVFGTPTADVLKNPATDFGAIPPRWFIAGDLRNFEDVGKRCVYLKMGEEPTLEGIRQAFLMPETRIRFPSPLAGVWGRVAGARFIDSAMPSWPRIESLAVEGGFHDKLRLEFAPGLNAIIGGKGTGKSTLIEILRYVLEAGEPAVEAKGNREHNFKANAEAIVTFSDGTGDVYQVRRSGGKDPARLSRGDEQVAVSVSRRVRLRIFGQREMQDLAEDPDLLLEFVATEAGPAWSEAATSERSLVTTIRDFDIELQAIEARVSKLTEDEHELADVTDRINTANAHGVGDHIQRLSALGAEDTKIRIAVGWPAKVKAAAVQLGTVLPIPNLPKSQSEQDGLRSALTPLGAAVADAVVALASQADGAIAELQTVADEWQQKYAGERSQIERELADAGLTDPRELGQLQTLAAELDAGLTELPHMRERAASVKGKRSEALGRLGDVRRMKSRLLEDAARRLNGAVGKRVRIRLDPLANTGAFFDVLDHAVKGQSVRSDQLEKLVEKYSPQAVASAIWDGPSKVEALGCSPATASKLCSLEPLVVRSIEETDTPDWIIVEVNLGDPSGNDAWHDVMEVSPGQRATALLALALAGGREPLIIDQPEDDLDNRYIYDEVVKVLNEVCQSRQVIVATHNANIPILGDAELIVALDAQADRGTVLVCGGLENPAVAEWSRRILEGGDAAFQARHRRYLAAGS